MKLCDLCGKPIYEVGWCQVHGMMPQDNCSECAELCASAQERACEISNKQEAERQRVYDALLKASEFRRLVSELIAPMRYDGDSELTTIKFLVEEIEQLRGQLNEREQ